MKTKIDILFEDLWGNEYKRMKEQISKMAKGPHGFGDIGKYEDGVLSVTEKEFKRLIEEARKVGITFSLASESGVKDYLEIGADYIKVAGKPIKKENQYILCDVRDCCLYVLTEEEYFLISEIYNYYFSKKKWPTARDILVGLGSIKIKETFEDFPKDELVLYNQHTEMYRLTLFGVLHLGKDKSLLKAIDFIMKRLKIELRNSKLKTKFLYEEIATAANLDKIFVKEITISLLGKLSSGANFNKVFYETNLPNDEERSLLILNYHNPISLCQALFVKERVFIPGVDAEISDYHISEITASRKGVRKMEKEIIDSKKVFIVHGHDEGSRESTARFVEKLGLSAIILHEQPSKGKTIIEKFEDYADVGFAIVLLTPDDVGAPSASPNKLLPRARQNVIFELGYFIGKLGRGHVAALYIEGVEIPSDYQGVIYVLFDKSGAWKYELAKELKTVWSDIDLSKLV